MTTNLRLWLVSFAVSGLSGCGVGYFSDRATNPIINANVPGANYTTLSTSAGRRTILVQQALNGGQSALVCAEPPPDALESYANAVALAAHGAASAQGGPMAGAEFGRNFATSAAPMLYRSQGLQMIRDIQFSLCMMRINGFIDDQRYVSLMQRIVLEAAPLIRAEIPAIEKAANRASVVVNTPAVTFPSFKEAPSNRGATKPPP